MGIKITGIKRVKRSLTKYPKEVRKSVARVFVNVGRKMVSHAVNNHKYMSRTGNLDRSIEFKNMRKGYIKYVFWINPFVTAVRWKGKQLSYGIFQHEGTGRNYRPSGLTKRYSSNKRIKGIKADHFIKNAFLAYKDILYKKVKIAIAQTANRLFPKG